MLFKCILTESTGNERENTSTWTDIRNFWPLMNEITKINFVLLLVKTGSYETKVAVVIMKVANARSKKSIIGPKWSIFGPN